MQRPGPILAVYCVRQSHAITCPFAEYFQILYILAQIFKYFVLFFFSLFWKIAHMPLLSRIGPGGRNFLQLAPENHRSTYLQFTYFLCFLVYLTDFIKNSHRYQEPFSVRIRQFQATCRSECFKNLSFSRILLRAMKETTLENIFWKFTLLTKSKMTKFWFLYSSISNLFPQVSIKFYYFLQNQMSKSIRITKKNYWDLLPGLNIICWNHKKLDVWTVFEDIYFPWV